MGEMRNSFKILVGEPEMNKLFGRPRCKREDKITVDLREIGWEAVDWIHLAWNRGQWQAVVNTVMNLRLP
jgi:hypothetical protein